LDVEDLVVPLGGVLDVEPVLEARAATGQHGDAQTRLAGGSVLRHELLHLGDGGRGQDDHCGSALRGRSSSREKFGFMKEYPNGTRSFRISAGFSKVSGLGA